MLIWIVKNGIKINELLGVVAFFILLAYILIFTPLAFFRKTRPASAFAFYIGSFVFGINLWIGSFVITLVLAGLGWLILGLFFAGVGVVPIAFIALLLNEEWINLFEFAGMIVMVFGFRILGLWLGSKCEDKPRIEPESPYVPKHGLLPKDTR
jgi:hypothetical protein